MMKTQKFHLIITCEVSSHEGDVTIAAVKKTAVRRLDDNLKNKDVFYFKIHDVIECKLKENA